MQQHEIHDYLEHFFTHNDCEILQKTPTYLEIQLTIEMDKKLMNRPFYWHYLEKTGGTPNPMKLTMITDNDNAPDGINGEQIHFGSPRLHQIFSIVNELGQSIRLYEDTKAPIGQQIALHPWLAVNYQVSFTCDHKKDYLFSFGIHLISGKIVEDFHTKLEKIQFSSKIPDFCYSMSPLIKPLSGLKRMEQLLQNKIEEEDKDWAEEARKRWQHDLDLLNQFYNDDEEKPENYHVEYNALKELYEPVIHVESTNGGLFYLSPNTMSKIV